MRSLGTFMILDHIARARRMGLPYVYLGYWVRGSRKMDYKGRFLPQERLTGDGWKRVERLGAVDHGARGAWRRRTPRQFWPISGARPGQPGDALDAVELTGAEPVLPSSFAVGTLAQATIAAAALAAGELWRLRTGRRQRDQRRHARCGDRIPQRALSAGRRQPRAGIYAIRSTASIAAATAGGSASTPISRITATACSRCSAASTIRAAVARALAQWDAEAFEAAAAEAGLVATMSRSFAEWDAHPQGRAVAGLPLFTIERIGDAPPSRLPAGDRPLVRHPGARPDARDRRAGVRPHARRARRRRAAGDRAAPAQAWSRWSSTTAAASSRPRSTCATPTAARSARRSPAGRRRLRAGLPARRHRRPRLRPAGGRAHPARHRLCLALRLRPRGSVGGSGAASIRWCRTSTASTSPRRRPPAPTTPKPLPAQALDHGTGYLMAFAAMTALARRAQRGRELARARLARPDRPLAAIARARRRPLLPRSRFRRRARPPGEMRLRLRPASRRCAPPRS